MQIFEAIMFEIKDKIRKREEEFKMEKKALHLIEDLFAQDKLTWAKELKEEKTKIKMNRNLLNNQKSKFQALSSEYEALMKKCVELDNENENLDKELRDLEILRENEENALSVTQEALEKELAKRQESFKWTKRDQEREIKYLESGKDEYVKENVRELWRGYDSQIPSSSAFLRELEVSSLKPKQHRVSQMKEVLQQLRDECSDLQKKNTELENQIALLESDSPF